ncbi:MAG: diguanylate cyclase [Holophagaceae bacterium]|nr:diguanylate cyclase [Holophagaceae bacterium]
MGGKALQNRAEALLGGPAGPVVEELLGELERLNARLEKISRISDGYQAELRQTNQELSQALAEVKTLQGFVPICAKCKRIRDDQGFWEQVESYLTRHSSAIFSHGVCPECATELFPNSRCQGHGEVEPGTQPKRVLTPPDLEVLEGRLRGLEEHPPEPLREELKASIRSQMILLRRFDKISRISDGYQAELKRLNAAHAEASRTDSLTGLLNRRGMMTSLNGELARSTRSRAPFSVIMLDVDQFKNINDTYGHEMGDRVLESLARTLQICLRDYDSIARWGGEEFLVLLPGVDGESALVVAEKVRTLAAELKLEHEGLLVGTTLCAGVAQWHPGEAMLSLLRRADDACYLAKRQGRNGSSLAP